MFSPLDGDGNSNSESVLDHLPPLDLPSEVTQKTTTPPVAPPAQRKPQSSAPTTAPATTPASDHLSGRSSREPDPALTVTAMPAPEPASSAGGAPGISRFVAVDLKLAAGSVPSAAGLDWLTEKGYKTLVDLRESSETDLPFIAEAARRGLRYIALPISLKSIDRSHVARFNLELAMGEARPLYFFDSNGTRAGTLWYIRRISVDRVHSEIARREAENLGLYNPDYWSAAKSYLERQDNLRSQALDPPGPVSLAAPQEAAEPTAQLIRSHALPGPPAPTPASSPGSTPGTACPIADATIAWQPCAAIVITGLTVPLGYWSRSVVPTILARTRASLPAPARRWKSLPRALDA